jgi:hypothetical protein
MLNEFANGFLLMVCEGANDFDCAFRRHCFTVALQLRFLAASMRFEVRCRLSRLALDLLGW